MFVQLFRRNTQFLRMNSIVKPRFKTHPLPLRAPGELSYKRRCQFLAMLMRPVRLVGLVFKSRNFQPIHVHFSLCFFTDRLQSRENQFKQSDPPLA